MNLTHADRSLLETAAHILVKHGELDLGSRLRGLARRGQSVIRRRPRGDVEAIAAVMRALPDGDLHTLFLSATRAGPSMLTAKVARRAEQAQQRPE